MKYMNLSRKIKETGKVGASEYERYLDLPDGLVYERFEGNDEEDAYTKTACQISYFSDIDDVMVYSLTEYPDGDNSGDFIHLCELPFNILHEILTFVEG